MQESSYRLGAKNCLRGVPEDKPLETPDISVCEAYGIAQIHYKSARRYSADVNRLMTDMDYSVELGARILSFFHKNYRKREPSRWFCRYYVGTASVKKIKKNCSEYIKLVNRWR